MKWRRRLTRGFWIHVGSPNCRIPCSRYVRWAAVDDHRARATLQVSDVTATGLFEVPVLRHLRRFEIFEAEELLDLRVVHPQP